MSEQQKSIVIQTPLAYPNDTPVKKPERAAESSKSEGSKCRTGSICVRAVIIDNAQTPPDYIKAEVYHSEPDLSQPKFATPPGSAHDGEVVANLPYNCRWDHDGGNLVDDVNYHNKTEADNNWLVIWAKWGVGDVWQQKDRIHVRGVGENHTACEASELA